MEDRSSLQGELFAAQPGDPDSPGSVEADGGARVRGSAAPARRRTFAVGQSGPRTRSVQYVDPPRAPLPGPWSLKAVVRGPARRRRGAREEALG